MIAVINKTIEVPNVYDQSIDYEDLSDAGRTALGTYRKDTIGVKRTWNLRASKLTYSQYKAIVDYLLSISQGETWFWLDEFGGTADTNSIKVIIEMDQDTREQFGLNGQWHSSGRSIGLRVIEK